MTLQHLFSSVFSIQVNLHRILGKFSSLVVKNWNSLSRDFMVSVSLEVFRNCVGVVLRGVVQCWTWQCWVWQCWVSVWSQFSKLYVSMIPTLQACRLVTVPHSYHPGSSGRGYLCKTDSSDDFSDHLLSSGLEQSVNSTRTASVFLLWMPFTFTNVLIRCTKMPLWANPSPPPKPLVKLFICRLNFQQQY